MVLVPGGEALLGQDRHAVRVDSFYIDKTEVTNAAYLMFCREMGHPVPPGAEQAPSDYPVVNVTIYDAQDFAGWAKKRLPSAVEWEKAARGAEGRVYPGEVTSAMNSLTSRAIKPAQYQAVWQRRRRTLQVPALTAPLTCWVMLGSGLMLLHSLPLAPNF